MKQIFLAFLLAGTSGILLPFQSAAQNCNQDCLVPSISVNTGYNHPGGVEYNVGDRDEYWQVVMLPVNAPTTEQPPYCAHVVWDTQHNYWTEFIAPNTTTTQWISALPTSINGINNIPVASHNPYRFQRKFYICGPSSVQVDINLEIIKDDYISSVSVDGVPYFTTLSGGPTYSSRTIIPTITVTLAPGAHTLEVDNRNAGGGIMGIDVLGTIATSSGNSEIVDNACYGRNICDAAPCQIEGDLDIQQTGFSADGCEFTVTANATTNGTIIGYEWHIPGQPPFIVSSSSASNTQIFTVPPGGGGAISVRVLVVNLNINPGESPCCEMTFDGYIHCEDGGYEERKTLKIGDVNKYGEIKVFPNPAQDNLNISAKKSVITDVQVLDVHGKVVKTAAAPNGVSNMAVSMDKLAPGTYIVRINNEVSITVVKN